MLTADVASAATTTFPYDGADTAWLFVTDKLAECRTAVSPDLDQGMLQQNLYASES